jgi:hypothetical protein
VDRTVVQGHLRDAVRAGRSHAVPAEIERLAAAMRDGTLATDEHRLSVHGRTAVRLLEADAPAPAWLTILHEVMRQPLVTVVDEGRAYAWLPGFRDPRVGVPDWIYEITDRVVAKCAVEDIRWESGNCVIGGWAHFSYLTTNPDEMVRLVLRRDDDGHELRVPAYRRRRPDRVKATGLELTRLAWAGFLAKVPGNLVFGRHGSLTVMIELERDGLVRRQAPSRVRGTVLDQSLPFTLSRRAGHVVRAGWDVHDHLELQQMSRIALLRIYLRGARRRARVFRRRVARHALKGPSKRVSSGAVRSFVVRARRKAARIISPM